MKSNSNLKGKTVWLEASKLWKHYTKMPNVQQMWFCYTYWTSTILPSVSYYCSWSLSKLPLVVRGRTSWTSHTHRRANMQTYTTIHTHIRSSVKLIHSSHQNWHFVCRPRVFPWWRWGVPCLMSSGDIISINKMDLKWNKKLLIRRAEQNSWL